MKRLHIFEIEDQAWCPRIIRTGVVEFLRTIVGTFRVYDPIFPLLQRLCWTTGETRFVDLCSGAGGPWASWSTRLAFDTEINVKLTDLFPQDQKLATPKSKSGIQIEHFSEPVSALSVSSELQGIRTLFSSLHHFRPDEVRQILRSAIQAKQPIAVFENTQRHFFWFLYCLLLPILSLLLTPLIRPVRWEKLLFTYIVPVIPFVIFFDGVVSGLRTYTTDELRELADEVNTGDFGFEVGLVRFSPFPIGITYLIGTPKKSPTADGADFPATPVR